MTCRHNTVLYIIPAVILMVGLGSAILIYLTAENDRDSYLVYEAAGGYVHPVSHEDVKMDGRDLKLLGAKANVPSDGFIRWFARLWHGKSLAFAVACITIYIFLGFIIVVDLLLFDLKM